MAFSCLGDPGVGVLQGRCKDPGVGVLQGHCKSRTWCLQAAGIYSLTILGAANPNLSVGRVMLPLKAHLSCILVVSCNPWCSLVWRQIPLISALDETSCSPCVWASVPGFLFSYKDTGHLGYRAHHSQCDLILIWWLLLLSVEAGVERVDGGSLPGG